ncbi:MAG: hypothetical protein DME18_17595 [Verrucomicrobia bacterium]|nr:MAG: hypothetical protein DME18_17595 [Verrucomicrobiota bacterium]
MKGTNSFPFVAAPISVLAGLCFASVALATPYASGVINSGGTVSFYLNEQAARVQVVFNNGTTTNDLGALPRGRYSFSLGTNNSFRIVVKNDSPAGYATGALLQLSDDSTLFHFNAPRGVAVNRNPASPYFGRIYVADSVAGTTSATSNAVARSLSDGIYALNPDASDALGQSDTPRTGGIAFDTSGTPGNAPAANSPWHIEVGEDDNLYVSDFSSVTGTIWQTDPNVSDRRRQKRFCGHRRRRRIRRRTRTFWQFRRRTWFADREQPHPLRARR